MDETETVLHGNFVKGKLHGNVRGLTFKEGQLTFIGKFKKGRPSGSLAGNCVSESDDRQ